MKSEAVIVALVGFVNSYSDGLAPPVASTTRRGALSWIGGACISGCIASGGNNVAVAADTPEGVDVDSYLRTGMVPQPMGVSGQAGKSKPETGVILRSVLSSCCGGSRFHWPFFHFVEGEKIANFCVVTIIFLFQRRQ